MVSPSLPKPLSKQRLQGGLTWSSSRLLPHWTEVQDGPDPPLRPQPLDKVQKWRESWASAGSWGGSWGGGGGGGAVWAHRRELRGA